MFSEALKKAPKGLESTDVGLPSIAEAGRLAGGISSCFRVGDASVGFQGKKLSFFKALLLFEFIAQKGEDVHLRFLGVLVPVAWLGANCDGNNGYRSTYSHYTRSCDDKRRS